MAWTFVVCELDTTTLRGAPIGEVLNAPERGLVRQLSGQSTANFTIRGDNPLVVEIMARRNVTSPSRADILLKVYQDSTLEFIGDCASANLIGTPEGVSLACVFAGPLQRLQKRLIKSYAETTDSRGDILTGLLTTANAEKDTGVRAGTIASSYDITAGPWSSKPLAEGIKELTESPVIPFETPASYEARDSFPSGIHGIGLALDGDTDEEGNAGADAWDELAGLGVANFITDGIQVGRAGSDAGPDYDDGNMATVGPVLTDQIVACVYKADYTGVRAARQGIGARISGGISGEALLAFVDYSTDPPGFWVVRKGSAVLASTTLYGWAANTYHTIRIAVDSAGRWAAWHYNPVTTPNGGPPTLTGQSDHLATGGATASGRGGLFDTNDSGVGTHIYDDFFVAIPVSEVVAQGIAFDLTPLEPTYEAVGTGGVVGAGVKIATLEVPATFGSTKPHAVFEFGDGGKGIKSFGWLIDRQGLMNYGESIVGSTTVTSIDQDSIDARGRFEDVVSIDLPELLAKALLDAHVAVRKTAKETFTFDASSQGPVFGTDYDLGDWVTVHVKINGVDHTDGGIQVRVYGVDIKIDAEGNETVTPTLVSE